MFLMRAHRHGAPTLLQACMGFLCPSVMSCCLQAARTESKIFLQYLLLFILTARTDVGKLKSCITLCVVVFIKVSFLGVRVGCSPAMASMMLRVIQ